MPYVSAPPAVVDRTLRPSESQVVPAPSRATAVVGLGQAVDAGPEPSDDDFSRIKPDLEGESLGSLFAPFIRASGAVYNQQRGEALKACVREWRPADAQPAMEGKITLNIRSGAGRLDVVSAEIQDANYADEDFEKCFLSAYLGSWQVDEAVPGRLYRMTENFVFAKRR